MKERKSKFVTGVFNISNSRCIFSPAILDHDSNFPSMHY